MQLTQASNAAAIRQLNDQFRRTFRGGKVMLTSGIMALEEDTRAEIFRQVAEFCDFNKANDPHDEHDFVAFEFNGVQVFAKIDYYSLDLAAGGEDPSNPESTTRVMTIMTADEY